MTKTEKRLAIYGRVKDLEKQIEARLLKVMDLTGDVLTDDQELCFQIKFKKIQDLTIWAACRYQRAKNNT